MRTRLTHRGVIFPDNPEKRLSPNLTSGQREAQVRLDDASPATLAACRCLLADLEGAVSLLDGDVPDCWHQSIREARDAIILATE